MVPLQQKNGGFYFEGIAHQTFFLLKDIDNIFFWMKIKSEAGEGMACILCSNLENLGTHDIV